MRRLLLFLLFLAASAAPAGAAITFNAGAPMTLAASYAGSARPYGGGIILHVGGTFDGANVALQVSGGAGWITADTCDLMTVAQVCRAAVGPVDLRLTITGPGAGTSITAVGFEVQAVVSSAAGGGAVTFDLVGAGTNANALVVGTGGTLSPTGSGSILASTFAGAATLTGQLLVIDGSPGSPAVAAASDTDAGIFFSSSSVRITSRAAKYAIYDSNGDLYDGSQAMGWLFPSDSAAETVPTLVPGRSDPDTGIGRDTIDGGVSIIDEATEVFRAVSTYGMTMGCKNFGSLSAAPAGAACDTYFDTDIPAWCCYTSSWVQCDDNTTGCS